MLLLTLDVVTSDQLDTEIVLTDHVTPADQAPITAGLEAFNAEQVGFTDRTPLAVLVKDAKTGQVLGGLTGRTSLGLLFVDLFYLPPQLRGGGLGGELLRRAEAEAVRRGCRHAVLHTISFQAPGFYAKQGWEVFGEVPGESAGIRRVFLRKALTTEPTTELTTELTLATGLT